MKNFRIFIGLILVWMLVSFPAAARRWPGEDWQQLETEHFSLVYPAAVSTTAYAAARMAEYHYPQVRELLGYAPAGRTPIVLNPYSDVANGWAQSIFRKIEIYLTEPGDKSFGPRDPEWLESVIIHEYAHLCQGMRDDRGISQMLSAVFGNVQGANFIAPQWWVEGVAVYAETKLTKGGRGRNPYENMRLDANLLSEHPWRLDQLGVPSAAFLPWDRVYLPGAIMLQVLAKLDLPADWLSRISANQSARPILLGPAWQRAVGFYPEEIWETVRTAGAANREKKYGVPRMPFPEAEVMTAAEAIYSQAIWLRDNQIIACQTSPANGAQWVSLAVPGKSKKTIGLSGMLNGQTTAGRNRNHWLYARLQPDVFFDDAWTSDLWAGDVSGRQQRLTFGRHAASPDQAADGRVVYVINDQGHAVLEIADENLVPQRRVPAVPQATYASPRWSPDGRQLAAVVRIQGQQDICLINPEDGALRPLTGWDEAGDWDPIWSPRGDYVYFISDRSGIHQLYAWDTGNQGLYRISDSRLGVFEPAVSPGGSEIIVAEYLPGNQQQLVRASLRPEQWVPVKQADPRPQPVAASLPETRMVRPEPYKAWPYLLPSFWVPMAQLTEGQLLLGAMTGQRDVLERHQWTAAVYGAAGQNHAYGEFSYSNHTLPVDVQLTGRSMPFSRAEQWADDDQNDLTRYYARQEGITLGGNLPVVWQQTLESLIAMRVGIDYLTYRLQESQAGSFFDPAYTGLDGQWVISAVRQAPKDFFPTRGFIAGGGQEWALPGHGYNGTSHWEAVNVFLPSGLPQQAFRLSASMVAQQGLLPASGYTGLAPFFSLEPNLAQSAALGIGYCLPVGYLDQGPGLWPVFVHGVWAEVNHYWKINSDDGNPVWQHSLLEADRQTGIVCNVATEWFWYAPLDFAVGVYYSTTDDAVRWQFDLELGEIFNVGAKADRRWPTNRSLRPAH